MHRRSDHALGPTTYKLAQAHAQNGKRKVTERVHLATGLVDTGVAHQILLLIDLLFLSRLIVFVVAERELLRIIIDAQAWLLHALRLHACGFLYRSPI